MAPRIGPAGVKQIINTTVDPTPFIEAAAVVVTDRLTGSGLSETTLKEIERWLAAHFIAIREPMKKEQEIDGAREVNQLPPVSSEGLKSTPYGQQVLLLDSSGILLNMAKRKVYFNAIDLTLEDS